jgi:hypothetical protein
LAQIWPGHLLDQWQGRIGQIHAYEILLSEVSVRGLLGPVDENCEGKIVVVDFFFWYLGTPLQKSTEGLLRSILYQIFRACKHMVKHATPRRWNASDEFYMSSENWTSEELWQCLNTIAQSELLDTTFYFFIDGLDEYHGEHSKLVDSLRTLAKNPKFRICVSSRPWNVFEQAFGRSWYKFRLEDLTAEDIRTYASDELRDLPKSAESQALIMNIVEKAHGVFLWVHLAVTSLNRGHSEGDTIEIMRARLEEIPSELEEFFGLILSHVEKVYKSKTAQVLRMALFLTEANFSKGVPESTISSFVCFWLLREGVEASDFATAARFRPVSQDSFLSMAELTRKFISATCKDLLQLKVPDNRYFDYSKLEVQFLHRTVYDYLRVGDIVESIDKKLPKLFSNRNLHEHLTLAQLKFVPSIIDHPAETSFAIGRNLNQPDAELRDGFQEALLQYCFRNSSMLNEFCKCNSGKSRCTLHNYLDTRLEQEPKLMEDTLVDQRYLLIICLGLNAEHRHEKVSSWVSHINTETVALLLRHGANPNRVMWYYGRTIWHAFLSRWVMVKRLRRGHVNHEKLWGIAKMLVQAGADVESKVRSPFFGIREITVLGLIEFIDPELLREEREKLNRYDFLSTQWPYCELTGTVDVGD